MLATEFCKRHGYTISWASLKKRTYPKGFYFKNKRQYINTDKVWFSDYSLNKIYHADFIERCESLYYELTHHFNEHRIGRLLSIFDKTTPASWSGYFRTFRFVRSIKSLALLRYGSRILKTIKEVYATEGYTYDYNLELDRKTIDRLFEKVYDKTNGGYENAKTNN